MRRSLVIGVLLVGVVVLITMVLGDDDGEPSASPGVTQADGQDDAGELVGRAGNRTDADEAGGDPDPGDAAPEVLDRTNTVRLTGTFKDSDGFGIPHAWIRIEGDAWDWRLSVKTGADGSFEEDLPREVFPIVVTPGPRWSRLDALAMHVEASEPSVALIMPADRLIAGEVVDEAGKPMAGATIDLGLTEAVTRKDGSFRLYLWNQRKRLLLKAKPSRLHLRAGYKSYVPFLASGGDHYVRVVVTQHEGLIGRLVWEDGTAVDNARLSVQSQASAQALADGAWSHRNFGRDAGQSDDEGEFAIVPLDPGRYWLTVRDGRSRELLDQVELSAPAKKLEVKLRRRARISGVLHAENANAWRVQWYPGEVRGEALLTPTDARPDATGRFSLDVPARSGGVLFAYRRGEEQYALQRVDKPGGPPVQLRLVAGGTISGRIEGLPPGAKLFHFHVYARQGHKIVPSRSFGHETFEFRGLPPGTWTVRVLVHLLNAEHDAYRGEVEATAGAEDLVLKVEPEPERRR
ncbi:MAG: carboxypeptidase-like regulatory domain-containing protein [Planctomycetota bacterium]|nr:carboxypeptidase-like regulatory domain-containing protein [Planctomycetota bacterium]